MKISKGFTFIEVMIVIAILGILAAITIPVVQGKRPHTNGDYSQPTVEPTIVYVPTVCPEIGKTNDVPAKSIVRCPDGKISVI